MQLLLSGGKVLIEGRFKTCDILISDGIVIDIAPSINISAFNGRIIECGRFFITPAFADLHVHLREPGYSYKATIASETAAAAAGGYTTVCAMPNLNPAPDSFENLNVQLDIIERDAKIRVLPYGCITKGENGEYLSDMEVMAPYVCGFSDDGRGVQSDKLIFEAMEKAKSLNKPIVAHCEVNELLSGGCIHEGEYAKQHNIKGICSESEWRMVERDLKFAEQTGCRYHICHISTKESVELLRKYKLKGLSVSGETAPHYIALSDADLKLSGRFKMNPPLRSEEDRQALIEAVCDGTISCIATDHAPHSAEEKSGGLEKSLFGVVGLETAFTVMYTELVNQGKLSLEDLVDRMSLEPRRFLGLSDKIEVGKKAEFAVLNCESPVVVNSNNFLSMGKATPFEGYKGFGRVEYTFYDGKIVWERQG